LVVIIYTKFLIFFFSSRRRHTSFSRDWSSDVCSSDLRRMKESLDTSAQLTTVAEVDVTRIAALRARAKDSFAAREGTKLTYLPFFVKAVTEALKGHPKLNATIDGDQVIYHDVEHIGIAADTPRGLLVPVV